LRVKIATLCFSSKIEPFALYCTEKEEGRRKKEEAVWIRQKMNGTM
jgi:hypothetical protein